MGRPLSGASSSAVTVVVVEEVAGVVVVGAAVVVVVAGAGAVGDGAARTVGVDSGEEQAATIAVAAMMSIDRRSTARV